MLLSTDKPFHLQLDNCSFDCLLSLGFGRPPSQPEMEAIDTNNFLSILASRPLVPPASGAVDMLSIHSGDYFIASQAQLMQISRDFIRSLEVMRLEAELNGGMEADNKDLSIATMCMDLNNRLDHWCRSWVWSVRAKSLSLLQRCIDTMRPIERSLQSFPTRLIPQCQAMLRPRPTLPELGRSPSQDPSSQCQRRPQRVRIS